MVVLGVPVSGRGRGSLLLAGKAIGWDHDSGNVRAFAAACGPGPGPELERVGRVGTRRRAVLPFEHSVPCHGAAFAVWFGQRHVGGVIAIRSDF